MASGKAKPGEGGGGAEASPPKRRAPRVVGVATAGTPAKAPRAGPAPLAYEAPRPELGLRPLGALVPRITRSAFKRRSPAGAMLMADWPGVVGPAIAAVTVPRRLSAGTLTIGCSGPMAMELQHLAPQLIGRINAALGSVTVQALRFVQQAPSGTRPTPARPAEPLPDTVRGALDTVGNAPLRDALARLAAGVYRKR